MNTYTQSNLDDLRLSPKSRIVRLAIGAILITIPMIQSEVLGTMAVLPLLAIYPVLTGILGFGLLEALVVSNQHRTERPPRQVKVARTSLFIVGTGMIAFVMASEAAPVWLALVAIFPVLMAILGSDLVSRVLLTRRALQTMNRTTASVVHARPSIMTGRGHAFEHHKPKQAA